MVGDVKLIWPPTRQEEVVITFRAVGQEGTLLFSY